MLSKSEMETLWRDQPYGAFKSIKSKMKGRKKFNISVEAYTRTLLPAQTFVAYAKNFSEACADAKAQFWMKNRDLKVDGHIFNIVD